MLKLVPEDPVHDEERIIFEYLNSLDLKVERNHTVPLLDVVNLPNSGESMFVMPLLRRFDDPPFVTVGEAVEFFRQLFEVRTSLLSYDILPTGWFIGRPLHARTQHFPWASITSKLRCNKSSCQ